MKFVIRRGESVDGVQCIHCHCPITLGVPGNVLLVLAFFEEMVQAVLCHDCRAALLAEHTRGSA